MISLPWLYRFISVLLLAAAAAAGWFVYPPSQPPADAVPLAAASGREAELPNSSPAFILDETQHAYQCGRLLGSPTPLLAPYADERCIHQTQATVLVVYNADLRLLWALLTEGERAEIAQSVHDTTYWLRNSVQASLAEPFFAKEYRPVVRDILRSSLERTLERPTVRDAFERALVGLDRKALEAVVAGIVPIATDHFEAKLWTNLQALAGGWLGGHDSAGSLSEMLVAVLNDPRLRTHLNATLPALVASPGMADAAMLTAVEFADVLIEDPRVPQLIQQLLTDRRLANFGRNTVAEGLPRKLLKLRSRTDHNPLSAYVVGLVMHGRSGRLLLMLTPLQYERLSRSAGMGMVLERRG